METQPENLKKSWVSEHPHIVIGLVLAVCLGPFINKAIHVDDPLFVWMGQWIQKHPADCFGFDVNWQRSAIPMWVVNWNPPLMAYFLAGVAWLFGWNEIILHLAGLAIAFTAAVGIYSLAKMWCERPLLATVVAIFTPAFLVSSTTLMCDVLMLTFWIRALVLWERALAKEQCWWQFVVAGVLAGLAVLTKYSAVTLLPLLPILGILRTRKLGWWWVGLAVPLFMVAGYELITARMYGTGLFSAAVNHTQNNRDGFDWEARGIIGLAFAGGSLLIAEGTPDYPDTGRFWRLIADHRVTYLGVSPTIVRSLMRYGLEVEDHDLSSLRITASGGEAWTATPWLWFFEHVCKKKIPIINISGGTEVGGCIFTGTPNHPMNPCSFSRPALGVGADIVDMAGRRVADGTVGELVLRHASIGLTKSLWKADARYLESYWSTLPGLWVHGDFAMRGHDGLYYILGRSDDTIKISGKRTGPAELEGILIATGKVAEAAVFGIPHPVKGSAIVCACVPMPNVEGNSDLASELSSAIVDGMGASYRPETVLFVDDLPRTRNLKIMRRVLRAVFEQKDPGDLSALANPEAVERLREKLRIT